MFLMNIFMKGGLIYMVQMVRALQMVVHLPMMRILMPANSLILINAIIEVAMYDIFPAERTTDHIFSYPAENDRSQRIFGQMQDIGYESNYALKNLGSLSIFTFLYFVKLAIIGVMKIMIAFTPLGLSKRFNGWYRDMVKRAFFADILAILIDAYFEFLISGYQQHSAKSKFS
jgi:hypothetical protein